ncbi:MAG TPA: ShlB/FhaC/HecB family hemolysin secretion/activation protein [Sedimentisphaerales bacterium]|nr:ShlB/FhaC/HecB family hemolysin secretion/activation protein [Sedimentisphaerales bacterium]
MSLTMKPVSLFLITSLVLTALCFGEIGTEAKKSELQEALEHLQESLDAAAPPEALTFPEDTSPRFVVKELQISGNSLISTAALFRNLSLVYTVSVPRDGKMVEQTYDFRVIHDLILNPGQDREVSLLTIQGLTNYILSVYQREGYAGVYVYVPAARVEGTAKFVDKILPIRVLEGKLAEMVIDRYDFDRQKQEKGFLKDSVLESWSPVKAGQVIHKKKLDEFVRLLNLSPDRYVSAVISGSADPNALKLSYDVYESNPWHWYLQVDNSGTKDRQWSPKVGVINTNLTGADDRFGALYQAPWEKGIEDEYALFGSYDFPVFTPRLRLNLYAGYSQFDIPAEGISFLGNGSFFGGVLSYNLMQLDDWFVDVAGSLSRERSKVTPSLRIASNIDWGLWGVGINVHRSDTLSNTSLSFTRSKSFSASSKDDFEQARLGAGPDFAIYNFGAAHSQYLDDNKVNRIIGSFKYITSDERLVPAKMTTFGGLYSVRGYEEDEIVTDGGILMSGQYEFDLVKYRQPKAARSAGAKKEEAKGLYLRKLAPLAFVDYGRAKTKSPIGDEPETYELCSLGVGGICEVGDDFTASLYYGWPLRETDATDRGEGRLSVNLIYRF